MPAKDLRPTRIKNVGDSLEIEWSSGEVARVDYRKLRAACPCAVCLEEASKPPNPFRILKPEEVAAGAPRPAKMHAVGHYAYQVQWNDGHSSGIYPVTLLAQLSEPPLS